MKGNERNADMPANVECEKADAKKATIKRGKMNLEPSKGRTSKKAPKNKAQKCGESGASKTFATPSQNVADVPIFAPDKPVDTKTSDATIAHVKVECKIKSRKGGSTKTDKEISLKESNSAIALCSRRRVQLEK